MGYSLKSESGAETGFNMFGWGIVRRLAQDFGWRPLGTEPPVDWSSARTWSGTYTSNDGQLVTAQDALALGAALEAALASHDFDSRIRGLFGRACTEVRSPGVSVAEPAIQTSDWRTAFDEFVRFCRRGGFRIL